MLVILFADFMRWDSRCMGGSKEQIRCETGPVAHRRTFRLVVGAESCGDKTELAEVHQALVGGLGFQREVGLVLCQINLADIQNLELIPSAGVGGFGGEGCSAVRKCEGVFDLVAAAVGEFDVIQAGLDGDVRPAQVIIGMVPESDGVLSVAQIFQLKVVPCAWPFLQGEGCCRRERWRQ